MIYMIYMMYMIYMIYTIYMIYSKLIMFHGFTKVLRFYLVSRSICVLIVRNFWRLASCDKDTSRQLGTLHCIYTSIFQRGFTISVLAVFVQTNLLVCLETCANLPW